MHDQEIALIPKFSELIFEAYFNKSMPLIKIDRHGKQHQGKIKGETVGYCQ